MSAFDKLILNILTTLPEKDTAPVVRHTYPGMYHLTREWTPSQETGGFLDSHELTQAILDGSVTCPSNSTVTLYINPSCKGQLDFRPILLRIPVSVVVYGNVVGLGTNITTKGDQTQLHHLCLSSVPDDDSKISLTMSGTYLTMKLPLDTARDLVFGLLAEEHRAIPTGQSEMTLISWYKKPMDAVVLTHSSEE